MRHKHIIKACEPPASDSPSAPGAMTPLECRVAQVCTITIQDCGDGVNTNITMVFNPPLAKNRAWTPCEGTALAIMKVLGPGCEEIRIL
jgi:hypothetical protein